MPLLTSKSNVDRADDWYFDFLIVGGGFSGLVLGERLSSQLGKRCLIVDRRDHIGGNSYDYYDDAGVLVHKYGPHYFRSDSAEVIKYLSNFTAWHKVEYTIKSWVDGRYWNFPINLNTYEQLIGRQSSEEEFIQYLANTRIECAEPKNSEEVVVSQIGWDLYEKFFKNYTIKQWKKHPRDLDPSVCRRIPIRTNRDDRYVRESFQAMPAFGYAAMFSRMVASTKNLRILLKSDYAEIRGKINYGRLIYTGAIDEYFDYCYGELPYRSLRFEHESFLPESGKLRCKGPDGRLFWQPAVQVNFPNDNEFTRIVELKHVSGQRCDATSIVREYPMPWSRGVERYYPIPEPEAEATYRKYRSYAEAINDNTTFVGRLANYRYYNMDQVVDAALSVFREIAISEQKGEESAACVS